MPYVNTRLSEQAIESQNTVKVSGGGAMGVLDSGKLESVLQNIKNHDYYPEFIYKITYLFFCSN